MGAGKQGLGRMDGKRSQGSQLTHDFADGLFRSAFLTEMGANLSPGAGYIESNHVFG